MQNVATLMRTAAAFSDPEKPIARQLATMRRYISEGGARGDAIGDIAAMIESRSPDALRKRNKQREQVKRREERHREENCMRLIHYDRLMRAFDLPSLEEMDGSELMLDESERATPPLRVKQRRAAVAEVGNVAFLFGAKAPEQDGGDLSA